MWNGAGASWEKKGGGERGENSNTVERTPVDEVVEKRREVAVADGTMEREKEGECSL